jgi:hypothetical protein
MPEHDPVRKPMQAPITTLPATPTHEQATRLAQEDDRGIHCDCWRGESTGTGSTLVMCTSGALDARRHRHDASGQRHARQRRVWTDDAGRIAAGSAASLSPARLSTRRPGELLPHSTVHCGQPVHESVHERLPSAATHASNDSDKATISAVRQLRHTDHLATDHVLRKWTTPVTTREFQCGCQAGSGGRVLVWMGAYRWCGGWGGGGGMVAMSGAGSGQMSRTGQGAWSTTKRLAGPRLRGPRWVRSPSRARMSSSAPSAAAMTSRSMRPDRSSCVHGRARRWAAASRSCAAEAAPRCSRRVPGSRSGWPRPSSPA